MTDTPELKPCPFCGGESKPKYDYFSGCSQKHHFVICAQNPNHRGGVACYNAAPGRSKPTDNVGCCDKCQREQIPCLLAAAAWNTRTALAAHWEEHDAEQARRWYLHLAQAALDTAAPLIRAQIADNLDAMRRDETNWPQVIARLIREGGV